MSSTREPNSPFSDIGGEWVGVYTYSGRQQNWRPARFTADFAVTSVQDEFKGTIIDADGIGEAAATGTVTGQSLQFVKSYRTSQFARTSPIHYEGTFSEDGRTAHGTWQINSRIFGFIPLHSEGAWRMQRPDLPEIQIVWPPPPQAPRG